MSTEQALVEELARVTEERDRLMEINWQRARVQAAIAVMNGMYANTVWNDTPQDIIAGMAAAQAAALITELQREVAK